MSISISRQLDYFLRLNNMSINEFAAKAGISYAYMNDLVNGKKDNPGFLKVQKMADAFEITLKKFVTPAEELEEMVLLVDQIELLSEPDRRVIKNMVDALSKKN